MTGNGMANRAAQLSSNSEVQSSSSAMSALAWDLLDVDCNRALDLAKEARVSAIASGIQHELATADCVMGRAYYVLSDIDQALSVSTTALANFQTLDDQLGQANARLTIGFVLFQQSDVLRALEECTAVLAIAREIDNKSIEAACLRTMGDVHGVLGDIVAAGKHFTESLESARQCSDDVAVSFALQRIARNHIHQGELDVATGLLHQAEIAAVNGGSLRARAFCQQTMGVIEVSRSNYARALELYTSASSLYESIGNKLWQAQVLHNIGNVHEQLGQFDQALEYWKAALKIQEIVGDDTGTADSLQGIGSAYLRMNDPESAMESFARSLQISKESGYVQGEGEALRWMGEAFRRSNRVSHAIEMYEQSVVIHHDHTRPELELTSLHALGDTYYELRSYVKAREYYEMSLALAKKIGAAFHETEALISLGELSLQEGEHNNALEFLSQALAKSTDTQTKELLYKTHKALADVHKHRNDFPKSLLHFKSFHDVKEEVFNTESDKRMKNLAVQYEVETKEREAEINRLKNVELVRLNDDLAEANRVKNEFLRVAAHDLKNPLAGIMLMSELTMQQLPADSPATTTQKNLYESSTRMLGIVNNLLDIAKLESGSGKNVKERDEAS